MKITLKQEQIERAISGLDPEFPKYVKQLLNLANQNAQGTRPPIVGQMSDLIQDFPGDTYEDWVRWYQDLNPEAIDVATDKVFEMLHRMQNAAKLVDRQMVREWVANLVLTKTYTGLRFQSEVLKAVASKLGKDHVDSTRADEARGIDGFIGDIPVSIKPVSYRNMNMLRESINCSFIYYEKTRSGLVITFDEADFSSL